MGEINKTNVIIAVIVIVTIIAVCVTLLIEY
jgi:hypothetical protein